MPYLIEVISLGVDSYADIDPAVKMLNEVQDEFKFIIPAGQLRFIGLPYSRKDYFTQDVFACLGQYRAVVKGNHPFIIAVIEGMLHSSKYQNLFGSHEAENGLAIFTLKDQGKFVASRTAFLCYYLIRYSLSFVAPGLKSHRLTKSCFFDFKEQKRDIIKSMNSGDLCDECMSILDKQFDPEIYQSLNMMIAVMKSALVTTDAANSNQLIRNANRIIIGHDDTKVLIELLARHAADATDPIPFFQDLLRASNLPDYFKQRNIGCFTGDCLNDARRLIIALVVFGTNPNDGNHSLGTVLNSVRSRVGVEDRDLIDNVIRKYGLNKQALLNVSA